MMIGHDDEEHGSGGASTHPSQSLLSQRGVAHGMFHVANLILKVSVWEAQVAADFEALAPRARVARRRKQ